MVSLIFLRTHFRATGFYALFAGFVDNPPSVRVAGDGMCLGRRTRCSAWARACVGAGLGLRGAEHECLRCGAARKEEGAGLHEQRGAVVGHA